MLRGLGLEVWAHPLKSEDNNFVGYTGGTSRRCLFLILFGKHSVGPLLPRDIYRFCDEAPRRFLEPKPHTNVCSA